MAFLLAVQICARLLLMTSSVSQRTENSDCIHGVAHARTTPAFGFWKLAGGAIMNQLFAVRDGLAAAGRLHPVAKDRDRISASEVLVLFLCGAVSASIIAFVRLGLRLPGHSILLSMLPMALGLSLAPRRLGGFLMSAGAFVTAAAYTGAGLAEYGSGAFVSLCLMGPMMDLAVTKLQSGWRVYTGLLLAGIGTNLMALASRATGKLLGLDPGTRPFGSWWTQAIVTYTLCGALAGLLGALCFFHFRKQRANVDAEEPGMSA
jgi:hypothetical protein